MRGEGGEDGDPSGLHWSRLLVADYLADYVYSLPKLSISDSIEELSVSERELLNEERESLHLAFGLVALVYGLVDITCADPPCQRQRHRIFILHFTTYLETFLKLLLSYQCSFCLKSLLGLIIVMTSLQSILSLRQYACFSQP